MTTIAITPSSSGGLDKAAAAAAVPPFKNGSPSTLYAHRNAVGIAASATYVPKATRHYDCFYDPLYISVHGKCRIPAVSSTSPDSSSLEVSGKNRHKFFSRPIAPLLSFPLQNNQYQNPVVYLTQRPTNMLNIVRPHRDMFSKTTTKKKRDGSNALSSSSAAVASRRFPYSKDSSVVKEARPLERSRSVAIQSMYRESDCQTDPYSPAYVVKPGEYPEILSIEQLAYRAGTLPVSADGVRLIQKMRQKRKLEAMLPPPTDEFSFRIRSQLLQEQEFLEWAEREAHIKQLQEQRLQLLQIAINDRRAEVKYKRDETLKRLQQRKLEERDRHFAKIERKRLEILRKMHTKRAQAANLLASRKRNIIEEYTNYGSAIYAPLAREGQRHPREDTSLMLEKFGLAALQEYNQLEELDQFLSSFASPSTHTDSFVEYTGDGLYKNINNNMMMRRSIHGISKRKECRIAKVLENTAALIRRTSTLSDARDSRVSPCGTSTVCISTPREINKPSVLFSNNCMTHEIPSNTLSATFPLMQSIGVGETFFPASSTPSAITGTSSAAIGQIKWTRLLERSETPRVEDVSEQEARVAMAVLFLQRLLRGRAVQNRMFEGKQKRLALINELRAGEQLEKFDQQAEEDLQKLKQEHRKEGATDAIWDSIQGHVISQTLDDLSKELRRFEEERRIAGMVKLAERDRRHRQALESGKRQAEEILRAREDQMFQQIMGVHEQTVESYLENIFSNTVERTAKHQALEEAKLRAAHFNDIVDELENEEKDQTQNARTVVRHLVSSFLLPHVQRQDVKLKDQKQSESLRRAAQAALAITVHQTCEALKENPLEK